MGNRDWQRHMRKRKRDIAESKKKSNDSRTGRKDTGIDKDLKGLK